MRHILFFFVDGVGLGPEDSSNPLADAGPGWRHLAGGQSLSRPFSRQATEHLLVRPIDAGLGLEGLPQSGTGQASLLTGVNCAALVGRHFGPFPHSKTHSTLDARNLFRQVQSLSEPELPVAFANAFPPQFFNAPRRRSTVTTYCCEASGVTLRTLSDLQEERALPADLTGTAWREHLGLDAPRWSPADAAEVLRATAQDTAFTLFEYFLTDKVGHARTDLSAERVLDDLDRTLGALLDTLDPDRETLVVTSDHGNLEDLSHKQHTRNPVPLLVHGWAAPYFSSAADLTDVAPAIVRALRTERHSAV